MVLSPRLLVRFFACAHDDSSFYGLYVTVVDARGLTKMVRRGCMDANMI